MEIQYCPLCGDFDIGDWCNHCDIPTKTKFAGALRLTKDEYAEVEEYYSRLYEEYINANLPSGTE